jgi:5-oxoprolinase (ATP-hydrolysing)
MHSYRNPCHEQAVSEVLHSCGFEHVSGSADLAPLMRLLPRAETAVVDAYLAPVIEAYLEAVARALVGGRLSVMTSAGGLAPAAGFRPKESLLSGPAGGVVGAARAGHSSGLDRLISFDMGGTSTDVARFDGDYDYQFETRVGDARILAPALAIETVAAGGGSICRFDGRQLKVGPESAGASPGPACYGAGGPLTLTDVNLLLGRLDPTRFEIPLSVEQAELAGNSVLAEVRTVDSELELEQMLHGYLSIADERMAEVIRRISVRKGYDPADYTLVAFGGAGAQHAVGVASRLGLSRVSVPPDASLLSARGLGHALVERFVERQILEPAEAFEARAEDLLEELDGEACQAVIEQGIDADAVEVRRRIVAARLAGQESTLEVPLRDGHSLVTLFAEAYRDRFGYPPPDRQIEIESVRVVASTRADETRSLAEAPGYEPAAPRLRRCHVGGAWAEVPCFERDELTPGARADGPLLVLERFSATVVDAGWSARMDGSGALILERGRDDRAK